MMERKKGLGTIVLKGLYFIAVLQHKIKRLSVKIVKTEFSEAHRVHTRVHRGPSVYLLCGHQQDKPDMPK